MPLLCLVSAAVVGAHVACSLTCASLQTYKGFVVVDEAYIDFADTASLCTLVNNHRRLIVLQTLSKGFGLAGIRLGCAFGDSRLIQILNNIKAPYNISKLTAKVRPSGPLGRELVADCVSLCRSRAKRLATSRSSAPM